MKTFIRSDSDTIIMTEDGSMIRWRNGTGGNLELTYLKTTVARQGIGRKLFRVLLERNLKSPPYATVYGFTRVANVDAQAFYRAMGFTLTTVRGVYDDGEAFVFSARYDDLCQLHGVADVSPNPND